MSHATESAGPTGGNWEPLKALSNEGTKLNLKYRKSVYSSLETRWSGSRWNRRVRWEAIAGVPVMGVGGRDPDCDKWDQEINDLGQGRA